MRGGKRIHLLCFTITFNQIHLSRAKLYCELQIKDTTLREENDCLHASFFKYSDTIWLSDLLILVRQNCSQTKETLIEVYFNFFTGKNLELILIWHINDLLDIAWGPTAISLKDYPRKKDLQIFVANSLSMYVLLLPAGIKFKSLLKS